MANYQCDQCNGVYSSRHEVGAHQAVTGHEGWTEYPDELDVTRKKLGLIPWGIHKLYKAAKKS